MTKITPDHLAREAVVYVRQSTAIQVANNLESQRRQYGLADRARQLGWADVEVIDEDLGRSGAGARRPGFEKRLKLCKLSEHQRYGRLDASVRVFLNTISAGFHVPNCNSQKKLAPTCLLLHRLDRALTKD